MSAELMSQGEKRIYISANSPGEISGWLKPVVKAIKKMLPEYSIHVVLLPCVFASGSEKKVVEQLPEVDSVIHSTSFFSLLLDRGDKSNTELLHLGGDITLTALLARKWKVGAWGYQWGRKNIDSYYRGYFVKAERDKEVLEKRGIHKNKIFIVGDLVLDSVFDDCEPDLKRESSHPVRTICFMPGSRLKEVRSLLPFYLELASHIRKRFSDVEFKAIISPYVSWDELISLKSISPIPELGGIEGTIDCETGQFAADSNVGMKLVQQDHIREMRDSDFLITIPGTKTGEAGCLGKPMAVLLPLNKPEDIPFIGLVGLLDWLPILGPRIKGPILRKMAETFGYFSQPNIMAGKEVVPEIKGILKAPEVASSIMKILEDQAALEKMRQELGGLYSSFQGATARMIRTFARAVKPGFEPGHPYFSVVICTRNRKEVLKSAVDTLDAQDYPSRGYEILIVDDGSTDGTGEMISSLSTRCALRYLRKEWSGRAATRNSGIREAAGDVIIFVDDDILAPRDFVAEHARYHRSYPRSIVRGPIINVEKHEFPSEKRAGIGDYSQAFFCTCNVSVSRAELLDIGGFDETFLEYGFEDNEIGWRLRLGGLNVRFNMKAIVYHYKPRKKEGDLEGFIRTAQELARSAILYHKKHNHWKVRLATGINPFYFAQQWLFANRIIKDRAIAEWKERVKDGRDGLIPLEKKIFNYYYTETLREQLKKMTETERIQR